MKRIILIVVLLLAGCGDPNYVEPKPKSQAELDLERAIQISINVIQPNEQDFLKLDIAPVVNGISIPDGIINLDDVVILSYRLENK